MADVVSQDINLPSFERAVYTWDGSQEGAESIFNQVMEIMNQVRQGAGFLGAPDELQSQAYTRVAAALTNVLTNPRFAISDDGFVRLCANHAQMHAIFRASAFETMDHILETIGTRLPSAPDQITFEPGQPILKMLLCWSLDSDVDLDFDVIAKSAPILAAWAIVGMLSVGGSHTPKSYARRLKLMRHLDIIRNAPLHPMLIQSAGDCYMHCSYTDSADKHDIKRVWNEKMFETVAQILPIQECSRRLVRKERPTIVIPVEWFGRHHAMYRCYAPSITELRERFRCVAIYRGDAEMDAEGASVFDKAVKLGDEASMEHILRAIEAEEPDILYYPSLGMAAWYVALSNFRLAPVQVISPGHPATSMSRVIDYMVSDGDLYGDAADYSEKLISLPRGTVRYIERSDLTIPPRPARKDGVVKIAIPAMATKVIPPFLEALVKIRAGSRNKVEFHFFPNMTGLSHTVMTKDLRRWFPDCIVRPRNHYKEYLTWLRECDFVASTFPFGGTNSTIDSFLLGIPVVTWECAHVHGRSDASMMRRVGLPEWLITHSAEEYIAAALKLADDVDARHEIEDHLAAADIMGEFYGPGPEHLRGGFLTAFEHIYEQELEAQSVGKAA